MADCNKIASLIREGEAGVGTAFEMLFKDVEFRKISKTIHLKYSALATLVDWQDLFNEAVVRLVNEVRKGQGPKGNGNGYFYILCRNICQEYLRKGYAVTNELPADTVRVMVDYIRNTEDDSLRDRIMTHIRKLGSQCQLFMWLSYFEEPPVTEAEKLAEAANAQKDPAEKTVSVGSVPVLMARCRKRLREILKDYRDQLF